MNVFYSLSEGNMWVKTWGIPKMETTTVRDNRALIFHLSDQRLMTSKCFKIFKIGYEWKAESRTLRGKRRAGPGIEKETRRKRRFCVAVVLSLWLCSTETGNGAVTHRKWADGRDKAGKRLRKSKQVHADTAEGRQRELLRKIKGTLGWLSVFSVSSTPNTSNHLCSTYTDSPIRWAQTPFLTVYIRPVTFLSFIRYF